MTHAQLVARVQRWLRSSLKHPVVVAEMGLESEKPDVIAWKVNGTCTLVECKVSRADFLRDRKKTFRMRAEAGMGNLRWYAAPPGLIELHELPSRWGLVEVDAKCMRRIVDPAHIETRNVRGETRTLVSALRRATEGWGRNVFGDISPMAGQIDPHPSVNATLKELMRSERAEREKRQRRDERIAVLEAENAKWRATFARVERGLTG